MINIKKCPLLLSLLCLCTSLPAEEPPLYETIEEKALLPLLSPTYKERSTEKLRLSNGIEVYIISDPNTDKSAAALAVDVGSWSNPKEHLGIAHFLEHMLFLGTKKYPEESGYKKFIFEHGGKSNAYTASSSTAYLFSIDTNAFPEALDRFSQLFQAPLLSPSGVARELQAIDQEYALRRDKEEIKQMFVQKELADPEHPHHQFHMGNSATLSTVSHQTLFDWFHSHYSANLMHLIILTPLPLEEIKPTVVDLFSSIPNKNFPLFSMETPTVTEATKGKMTYIEPLKELRQLSVRFELPSSFAKQNPAKPDAFLCFVLGHEGKESLLAQLKREKLATGLACGEMKLGKDIVQIGIDISLTKEGLKQVNTIIDRLFGTINLFRENELPSYLFEEMQAMAKINYQYQPRQETFQTVMRHSLQMVDEELTTYPEAGRIIQKFDPPLIKELLTHLTPYNASFELVAPSSMTGISFTHREPWTNTGYTVEPIDQDLLQQWSEARAPSSIDLPAPNPFVPHALTKAPQTPDLSPEYALPTPELLLDSAHGKIYFAKDSYYQVPKATCIFHLKTPEVIGNDPAQMAQLSLFLNCAEEALNEEIYQARLAGLACSFSPTYNGVSIAFSGYSENLPSFIKTVWKTLHSLTISKEQFKIQKELLTREYRNFSKETPLNQAAEVLQTILNKYSTTKKEKASALRRISYTKFEEFTRNLFHRTYTEGLLYGTLSHEDALEIQQATTEQSTPYPPSQQIQEEIVVLPQERGPFLIESRARAQGNAIILAIEEPIFSLKARAAQQLVMQVMEPAFFATLRTKQQTGYIAHTQPEEKRQKLFDLFYVQSHTHQARDLLARFELFLEEFLRELTTTQLPESRFEAIKQSVMQTLKTPPKSETEMAILLERLAFYYNGQFDWIEKRIEALDSLSYDEFVTLTKSFLGRSNRRRVAILMQGSVPKEDVLHYSKIKQPDQLREMSSYTANTDQN